MIEHPHQHSYIFYHAHPHVHTEADMPEDHLDEHAHAFFEAHSHGEKGLTPHSHKRRDTHEGYTPSQHHDLQVHTWEWGVD